jgi:hypothetical protein
MVASESKGRKLCAGLHFDIFNALGLNPDACTIAQFREGAESLAAMFDEAHLNQHAPLRALVNELPWQHRDVFVSLRDWGRQIEEEKEKEDWDSIGMFWRRHTASTWNVNALRSGVRDIDVVNAPDPNAWRHPEPNAYWRA